MDETSDPCRFTLAELEHAIAMKFRPWMSKVDAEIRSLKESNKDLLEEVNILKARCKSLKLSLKPLKSVAKHKQEETPSYIATYHSEACRGCAYQCSCKNRDYREQEHEPNCYSSSTVQCVCPDRYYLPSEHERSCQYQVRNCICKEHNPDYSHPDTSESYSDTSETYSDSYLVPENDICQNDENNNDVSSDSDEESHSRSWWSWFV